MTDHKQAAIEAIAEELHPGLFTLSDHRYSIRFDNPEDYRAEHQADVLVDVGIALEVALPHLREMIAQEILDDIAARTWYEPIQLGMKRAANIAEGGPQQ